MKMNKMILSLGALVGLSSLLTGCTSQTNAIRTNEFTISGEDAYKNMQQMSEKTILVANLKASDIKLLDKVYGSNKIDESKLLSQAKVKSGASYLEQIG
ncbi:MAG: hypothetical protein ACRCV7_05905, partial [Culicoidibacterales bacterium]